MDEKIIRAVSLYFYLNLFDSKQAFSASQKTLARWRDFGSGSRSDLIPIAAKVLKASHGFHFFAPQDLAGEFMMPANVNLDAWMEFKKRADASEYETILWSKVLNFTDEEVAQGLGVTEGTVRHRVNRALRELGGLL